MSRPSYRRCSAITAGTEASSRWRRFAVTSPFSKALWSLDPYRSANMKLMSKKKNMCMLREKKQGGVSLPPSLPPSPHFLSLSLCFFLSPSVSLALCVFISRQSIVVPLVGGAEQDDLRADLPSDAVGEMQPDSGMLSLSFQPPRSLSGRKSRRCVLTFGGTVMNIQELCWSLRIK